MKLRGTTSVYGILGDPVAHSLSPLMQNAAFAASGIDAVYVPFHVPPSELAAAVAGLRSLAVCGVNLTIPHKEAILPLLDEVDEAARQIGAVNTVVNRTGKLSGYNTDAGGFLASLADDLNISARGRRGLLLGAGGACRAAAVALASEGAAQVVIANRNSARAVALAAKYASLFPDTAFIGCGIEVDALRPLLEEADFLVNTSAVGLQGEAFPPWVLQSLAPAAAVLDMVYRRGGTPLVIASRAAGRDVTDGLGMLAGQGELAFTLWTGVAPPRALMKNTLLAECLGK
ncbi:MAG TPA: shikimate dehydrogenase [Desulfuromonas sp.]|nr:shikimate dehydrogenase [Desulfuromonas sp.]